MKILITGASGFIGSRLLGTACNLFGAHQVVAVSSRKLERCACVVYGSIDFVLNKKDADLLDSVDVLIHAGAYTPKSTAEANAIAGCNGNILFTHKLLGQSFSKLKKILYVSTLDVYAQAELITESTPTLPATLYGLSKLYCEGMVSSFAADRNIPCQILRIGHVYGPGEEKYRKFLPTAIESIIAGKPIELLGDGSETRSFIYIDDVVEAVLNAANLKDEVGVINIAGGVPVTIRQLIDKLAAISGKSVEILAREHSGIKKNYDFDNTKLKTYLLPVERDLSVGLREEYDYLKGMQ